MEGQNVIIIRNNSVARTIEVLHQFDVKKHEMCMRSIERIKDFLDALKAAHTHNAGGLGRLDVGFGETPISPVRYRSSWISPVPVHARHPPDGACMEHPKKSGI